MIKRKRMAFLENYQAAILLFLSLFIFSIVSGQTYDPSRAGTTSNKPYAPSSAAPTDSRSYFYDQTNFVWRPYVSLAEVRSYLYLPKYRTGQMDIVVNTGGILTNGVITGGVNTIYYFKDGVNDTNLVQKFSAPVDTSLFLRKSRNLSDLSSVPTAKTNLGLNNVDNTSDATKWAATATLTNKTISGNNNTLLNIPNSALNNSSIGVTLGTSGTDFNVSGTPASLGSNFTFNFPVAGPGVTGKLSGTDWNNFNNKLSNITGLISAGSHVSISGSGTIGSPYVISSTGGSGGSVDSIVHYFVDTTLHRNGYVLSFDSLNHKWVLAPNGAGTGITALTGDGTASGSGSVAFTLATVNTNVGSFGTASSTPTFSVNGKGLIVAAANTPIQIAESQVTNLITDLASKQGTITLTTTGSSGPATFISNVLNIPQYSGTTNLGSTQNATNYSLTSSSGTGTTLLTATTSLAGLLDTARAKFVDSLKNRILKDTIQAINQGSGVRIAWAGHDSLYLGTLTNTSDISWVKNNDSTESAALTTTGVSSGSYTWGNFTVDTKGRLSAASSGATGLTNYSDVVFGNGQATSQALIWHQPVAVATTAALATNTYSNGTAGVGATITCNTNGALTIDGYTVATNDRILVKDEVAQSHNGIYTVTQTGSSTTPFILTRGSYSSVPANMVAMSAVGVQQGSVNIDKLFVQTTTGIITFGTTSLVYAQISGSGGGGNTNSNIGSGFRLAVPSTNNIKTLFCSGCTIDSTTNSNALTITVSGGSAVTNVATGLGLSGGPITTTGTIIADTSYLFTKNTNQLASGNKTFSGTLTAASTVNMTGLTNSTGGASFKVLIQDTTTGKLWNTPYYAFDTTGYAAGSVIAKFNGTKVVLGNVASFLTLTTTGTSGAATLSGSTLNIPQYSGGSGGDSGIIAGANIKVTRLGASSRIVSEDTTNTTGLTVLRSNSDMSMMPQIQRWTPVKGIAASSSVTNYDYSSVDTLNYLFSTSLVGTEGGGWLSNSTSGDSITFWNPTGVCIGHSIISGRPWQNSGMDNINYNKIDSFGTISYRLTRLTNFPWINMGIGGQNSFQIRARFLRDAFGFTSNPNDGRGSNTILHKPNFILIDAWVNDPGAGIPVETTEANALWMAQQCYEQGVPCIMLNCEGDGAYNQAQVRWISKFNDWMKSGALDAFNVTIIDANSFWNSGQYGGVSSYGNDNIHYSSFVNSGDLIHFTQNGYDSVGYFVYRYAHLPTLTKVAVGHALAPSNPIANYNRPTSVSLGGTTYSLTNTSYDTLTITAPILTNVSINGENSWLKVLASTNVTGSSTQTGVNWLYCYLDNNPNNASWYTRKSPSNGAITGNLNSSSLKLITPQYGTFYTLDVQNFDTTRAFQVVSNSGSANVIINGGTINNVLNGGVLSVNSGAGSSGSVGISTPGQIRSGANNVFGQFNFAGTSRSTTAGIQFLNGTSGFTGTGMSIESSYGYTTNGRAIWFSNPFGKSNISATPNSFIKMMAAEFGIGSDNTAVDTVVGIFAGNYKDDTSTSGTGKVFFNILAKGRLINANNTKMFDLGTDSLNVWLNMHRGVTYVGPNATASGDTAARLQVFAGSLANPLKLMGVQLGGTTSSDSVLTINNGIVQKLPVSTFVTGLAAANGLTLSSGTVVLGGTLTSTLTTINTNGNTLGFSGSGLVNFQNTGGVNIASAVMYAGWSTTTSGSSATIPSTGYVNVLLNPASLLSTFTYTLPASPLDGQIVKIHFGGTITSGNAVVTTLTISPSGSNVIVQGTAPTTASSGDCLIYEFNAAAPGTWYRER